MNNWIMSAYSDTYNTAMMLDVKHVATAKVAGSSRFGKLVKLFTRA